MTDAQSIFIRTSVFPVIDFIVLARELQVIEAKTCIEFGPGSSTDALIRCGLKRIVTCEHDPRWYEPAKEGFKKHPVVEVLKYTDTIPVVVEGLPDDAQFDCGFVDSPKGSINPERVKHPGWEEYSRLNTMLFALERAKTVFLHDCCRHGEWLTLVHLASLGHRVDIMQGFAKDHFNIPISCGLARVDRYDPTLPPREDNKPLGKPKWLKRDLN